MLFVNSSNIHNLSLSQQGSGRTQTLLPANITLLTLSFSYFKRLFGCVKSLTTRCHGHKHTCLNKPRKACSPLFAAFEIGYIATCNAFLHQLFGVFLTIASLRFTIAFSQFIN